MMQRIRLGAIIGTLCSLSLTCSMATPSLPSTSTTIPTSTHPPLLTPTLYHPASTSTPVDRAAPSDNLLLNPGFEDDFDGWDHSEDPPGATTEIDTAVAHSGSKSLRITFDGSEDVDYWHVGQEVSVEPNATYLLQGYLQVSNIRAYHSICLVVTDGRGWEYLGYTTADLYTTQDWTLVSTIAFTTLTDTQIVYVSVGRGGMGGSFPISGTVWVDDVSLVRLPPQIAPSVLTLRVGDAQDVVASSGAAPFAWASSDPSVATVESTGDTTQAHVTAMTPGEASITTVDDDGRTGVLTLTVINQSTITVNASHVLREVPEAMFGNNLDYTNSYPWTVWGNASPAFTADVAELDVTSMRFPGGTDSNYYDFSLGKGWINWIGGSEQYNMVGYNTDDFIQFLQDTGVPNAMITANVYKSGRKDWPGDNWISAQVAADWVEYVNHQSGFYVEYWELGNEIFYNGQMPWDTDPQVPGLTPELYLQKIHEWSQAMKAVDPTIKIGVALQLPEKGDAGEWWDLPIIQERADDFDFVVVHPYVMVETSYLEDGNIVDSTATNVYAWIWATHPIADLRQWINTFAPARANAIEIQASEWDVYMHDILPDGYDTLLSAVLNTDLLWDMVQEGADGANNWSLDMTLGADGEGTYRFAQYYMLWMNRHRSGRWLVESQVTSPTYTGTPYGNDEYALRSYGTVDGVPYLSAYATLATFTYTFPARSVTSFVFQTSASAMYLPLVQRAGAHEPTLSPQASAPSGSGGHLVLPVALGAIAGMLWHSSRKRKAFRKVKSPGGKCGPGKPVHPGKRGAGDVNRGRAAGGRVTRET
jgi:hypothetical protein